MKEELVSRAVSGMILTDRQHKALIDARVSDIGLHRSQLFILMQIAERGSLVSQKEIADRFHISQAAVTGALHKLEGDGYITRTRGEDNRYNRIELTEKGRDTVECSQRLFSETDRCLFEGFDEAELVSYIACLEKIRKNMEIYRQKTVKERRIYEKMV